nr:MAG TPA: lytic transglycosylase [Caudoviricetes sp.]
MRKIKFILIPAFIVLLAIVLILTAGAENDDMMQKQLKAHEIAELARELGLPEDDVIIERASALWWEWENQKTEEPALTYLGKFKCYAYCPCTSCCGKYASGITATGTTATAGRTIAVDPSVIPLGSKVVINGQPYIAEDTGGGIKGKKIDIFMDSHREALNFGVRWLDVYMER